MKIKKRTSIFSAGQAQNLPVYSLRAKMMVYFSLLFITSFVIFELITLFGLPFTGFKGQYKNQQSDMFRNLNLVADLKKDYLEHWIKERFYDGKTFSEDEKIRTNITMLETIIREYKTSGMDNQELWVRVQQENIFTLIAKQLRLIIKRHPTYEKVEVVDLKTGVTIASTKNDDLGKNIFKKYSFSESIKQNVGLSIGILESRKTSHYHLLFPFPVEGLKLDNNDGRKSSATLLLHVNQNGIIKPMLHTGKGLGQTGEVILVDQDLNILSFLKHNLADGTKAIPLNFRITAKPAMMAAYGEEGITSSNDYRGKPVLAAYRYIPITPELGWGMVVKQDREEVFAPLYHKMEIAGFSALVFVLITLAVANGVSKNLSLPLKNLSKIAKKVTEGDFSARTQETGYKETRILATAFNSMIKHVQDWNKDLKNKVKEKTAELNSTNELLKQEITIRKKAEETLERNQNKLNELIEERTCELQKEIKVRKRAEEAALYSKNFERLLSQISSKLIGLKSEEVDNNIIQALKKIGEFARADASYIFKFSDNCKSFSITHLWSSHKLKMKKEDLQGLSVTNMPWWMDQLKNDQPVAVSSVANLPKEAEVEKGIIQSQGIGALVDVPLNFGEKIIGFLGLSVAKENRLWSKEEISLLRLTGQLFTNTLKRKHAEEEVNQKLKELEKFNRFSNGRENQMIKLKKEINDLRTQLGREKIYNPPME